MSDDVRDPATEKDARPDGKARPQRTSGVPGRLVDPPPAVLWVGTFALVVLALEVPFAAWVLLDKLERVREALISR